MKKVGTFFDEATGVNYDLYSINARTIKKAIDDCYNLTPLKLKMFNSDKDFYESLHTEIEYRGLELDWVKGEVLNLEEYKKKNDGYSHVYNYLFNTEEDWHKDTNQLYYELGFELMPIAVSLKNKDVSDLKDIELLDGYRRLFCSETIPDRDIFVRVYDVLSTVEWLSAMLLFNSWKLLKDTELFLDRGFKLGLWRHFGIDITLYGRQAVDFLRIYISSNPYNVLKNNQLAITDMKLVLDAKKVFTGNRRIFLKKVARTLSHIRHMEFNRRESAQVFELSDLIDFTNEKKMAKLFKKIDSMHVGGFIENNIDKNIMPRFVEFARSKYGLQGKIKAIGGFACEWRMGRFFEETTEIVKKPRPTGKLKL